MPLIPKKIDPCPIIEALLEIRFKTNINPNAVFGLLYSSLGDRSTPLQTLPILQIPEQVRNIDPSFRHKPHYKIDHPLFPIQIGPDVINIACIQQYQGWDLFSSKIFSVLNKLSRADIITDINRLGLRYINFFDFNIFEKLDFNFTIGKTHKGDLKNTVIRTEINHDDLLSSTLQISNNANFNNRIGSLIDIDTFKTKGLENFFENMEVYVNETHQKEKELFFDLLNKEFLNSLKPEY